MMTLTAYESALFDLPEEQVVQRVRGRTRTPPRPRTHHQLSLWLDVMQPPSVAMKRLPVDARSIRVRLRDHFDALRMGPPPVQRDTRDHWRRLLPLIRGASYTSALVDGAYTLYVEYRDVDKYPHYRLTWGHMLFGRVDVHLDTNLYGGIIRHSEALPQIQERLAAYLMSLGYCPTRARLVPHEVDDTQDTDDDHVYRRLSNTATREFRLFKLTIDDLYGRTLKRKKTTHDILINA